MESQDCKVRIYRQQLLPPYRFRLLTISARVELDNVVANSPSNNYIFGSADESKHLKTALGSRKLADLYKGYMTQTIQPRVTQCSENLEKLILSMLQNLNVLKAQINQHQPGSKRPLDDQTVEDARALVKRVNEFITQNNLHYQKEHEREDWYTFPFAFDWSSAIAKRTDAITVQDPLPNKSSLCNVEPHRPSATATKTTTSIVTKTPVPTCGTFNDLQFPPFTRTILEDTIPECHIAVRPDIDIR